IDASGGPPIALCNALSGRGGTWNQEGVIIFSPNGSLSKMERVSASGGVPAPVNLDVSGRWPSFLPDSRHFLYSSGGTVRLGSLDSKETRRLIEALSDAVYSQGHLIYLRENTLMAQPFNLKSLALSGEPVPVAENVRSVGAQRRGIFSVSQNGALVYQSGVGQGRFRLTWFDRTGKKLGTAGDPVDLLRVSLSADGKTVATSRFDPINFTWDLWQYDAARVLQTRFTFEGSDAFLSAVWSPDGASIAYGSIRNGKYGVFRKAANL